MRVTFATLLASLVIAPVTSAAQAATNLVVLSEPAPGRGTCLELPAPAGRREAHRGRQLVIASAQPAGRRELMLFTRPDGTVIGFADHASRFDGGASGSGESIVAWRDSVGRWSGFRTEITLTVDTAALRAGRVVPPPQATMAPATRTALTPAEVARVAALAAWLGRRCRAEG